MEDDDLREDMERTYNKKLKAKFISSILSTATAAASVAVAAGLVVSFFFTDKEQLSKTELTEKVIAIEERVAKQEQLFSELKNELAVTNNSLKSLSSLPKDTKWGVEARKLENEVANLKEELDSLESALTTDPTKALAVPILRKDLDNAEKSIRSELSQTKSNIDRIYDQNKWFIGLMFTIALSVLGIAIGSFFKK